MQSIAEAIRRIDHQAETYRTRAANAMQVGETSNPIIAATTGTSEDVLGYSNRLVKHSEQYKHYVGWPYVAINTTATRLSGQPVKMGRALAGRRAELAAKLVATKGWPKASLEWRQMFGRQLLNPVAKERGPEYIKSFEGEVEVLDSHLFLDVLKRPNDITVRASLFLETIASLKLTGLAYWWLPVVKGRRLIHHIPVDWVSPKHKGDKLYSHYEVKPYGQPQDTKSVPGEEIIRFALPDPSDPHGVVSPLQTQAPAVAADEAIQVCQYRGFKNGLHPGLILTVGRHPDSQGGPGVRPILEPHQRKDVIELFRAMYEDALNYGEPFILDGLFEGIHSYTHKMSEMDFLKSGQMTKARIMQGYGVNPFVAGENVTVGWSQAAVAEHVFCSNVVNPLGVLVGEHVTAWLWREDPLLLFWIEEASPKNPELRLKRFTAGVNLGACDPEEFREIVLELPPRDKKKKPPKPDEDLDEEDEDDEGQPRRPWPSARRRGAAVPLLRPLRRAFETLWTKQADGNEARMAAAMRAFFARMGESVVAALNEVLERAPQLLDTADAPDVLADEIYRPIEWQAELRKAAFKPLAEAAFAGYMAARATFEERWGPMKSAGSKQIDWAEQELTDAERDAIASWQVPRNVREGITRAVSDTLRQPYWQKILDTTGADIRRTLKRAVDKGWARHKIAKTIAAEVGDASGKRGKRIAFTETTSMMNAGAEVQAAEVEGYGLAVVKIWITIGDDLVRDEHAEMEGQAVKGADGLFRVGGHEAPYPGHWSLPAELRIHCRCSFLTDLEELMESGLGSSMISGLQ